MRTLKPCLLAVLGLAVAASAASAFPTYTALWSGTTGTGVTGGATIDAATGDFLTLDVFIINDPIVGITSYEWAAVGSPGMLAISGRDCVFAFPGFCLVGGAVLATSVATPITAVGNVVIGFDATGPTAGFQPTIDFVGSAVFLVTGLVTETVNITFSDLLTGPATTDALFTFHQDPIVTLTVTVPEPGTAALLALGLAGLAVTRRIAS